jgi:hypothetical protein
MGMQFVNTHTHTRPCQHNHILPEATFHPMFIVNTCRATNLVGPAAQALPTAQANHIHYHEATVPAC